MAFMSSAWASLQWRKAQRQGDRESRTSPKISNGLQSSLTFCHLIRLVAVRCQEGQDEALPFSVFLKITSLCVRVQKSVLSLAFLVHCCLNKCFIILPALEEFLNFFSLCYCSAHPISSWGIIALIQAVWTFLLQENQNRSHPTS